MTYPEYIKVHSDSGFCLGKYAGQNWAVLALPEGVELTAEGNVILPFDVLLELVVRMSAEDAIPLASPGQNV